MGLWPLQSFYRGEIGPAAAIDLTVAAPFYCPAGRPALTHFRLHYKLYWQWPD